VPYCLITTKNTKDTKETWDLNNVKERTFVPLCAPWWFRFPSASVTRHRVTVTATATITSFRYLSASNWSHAFGNWIFFPTG
jgi:hypothetical protein